MNMMKEVAVDLETDNKSEMVLLLVNSGLMKPLSLNSGEILFRALI